MITANEARMMEAIDGPIHILAVDTFIAAINYYVSKNLKTHEVKIKRGKDKPLESICVRLAKSKGFDVTMDDEVIKISW